MNWDRLDRRFGDQYRVGGLDKLGWTRQTNERLDRVYPAVARLPRPRPYIDWITTLENALLEISTNRACLATVDSLAPYVGVELAGTGKRQNVDTIKAELKAITIEVLQQIRQQLESAEPPPDNVVKLKRE